MARTDSLTRKKILNAAIGIFAAHGLKGATIQKVGRAAGVNSALLYYYFEDKDTLFNEALRHVLSEFLDSLERRPREFSSARERIEFLAAGIASYHEAHPERFRLILVAISMHQDRFLKALRKFIEGRKSLVPLDVLREGQERGEIRPGHPLFLWWSILGASIFSLEMANLAGELAGSVPLPPVPDPAARRALLADFLERGLSATPSPNETEPPHVP
ncbi:MAG: TetR/AcrR family transcriptional regulator [Planctomycetota bacterium]